MKQKETGFFFRNGFSNFLSTRGNALVRTPLNVMLIAMALIVVTSCTTTKGEFGSATERSGNLTKSTGTKLVEGFEGASTWMAVGKNWGDGDTSKSVSLSTAWASEGKSSLELVFNPMVKDKGATCFTEMMDITDFSPYEAVLFDVNNPTGQAMQVAVAVTTGDGWVWFESNVFDLSEGESRDLRVELYEETLKTAATNWEFKSRLLDSDDVRRIAFKFFGPEDLSGSVFVDNIRLVK